MCFSPYPFITLFVMYIGQYNSKKRSTEGNDMSNFKQVLFAVPYFSKENRSLRDEETRD